MHLAAKSKIKRKIKQSFLLPNAQVSKKIEN